MAAFAQFDNDVRSDRTRAGMRAALELGHDAYGWRIMRRATIGVWLKDEGAVR